MAVGLDEIDRLIAAKSPSRAAGGVSLAEIDRLIGGGVAPSVGEKEPPLEDVGQLQAEVERLGRPRLQIEPTLGPPRSLMGAPAGPPPPPSQAEIAARQPGQLVAETGAGTVPQELAETLAAPQETPPISAAPILPKTLGGLKRGAVEGAAAGLPGLALQAVEPELFSRAKVNLPGREEEPESVTEQAVRAVVSLADPVTAAFFLLTGGFGAAAVKSGMNALTAKFGEAAVRQGLKTAATRMAGSGTAFAAYDAARDALEQTGAVGRGEQEKVEPGRVLEAAGRGALVGASMGLATLPAGTLLRKAAEVGVLATVPPIIEGRAPTAQDVLDAGVLVGALTVAGRLQAGASAALRKPRPQRTPEEQQAVEAIPEADKAEIVRQVAEEAQKPPERAAAPPQAEIAAQPVEEAVQRAEAAAKRANEALTRMEELARRPFEPSPLERPPEEAEPENLPAPGRIAEGAREITPEAPTVPPEGTEPAPPTRLWIMVGTRRYPVASFEEASGKFRQVVEAAGTGAGETPTPLVVDDAGTVIGYVAYNGKVFPGRPEAWKPGQRPLYDPSGTAEVLPERPVVPSALATEPRPTVAEVPPPAPIPQTFRAFVEAQGRRWPVTVRDPDYVRLRQEYDALRKPRYEKRGVEVVETATGRVVGTGRNGAEAQLLANRMNAGAALPTGKRIAATQEEAVPNVVQRIEEPSITAPDFNKPQGVYTSPLGASPHEDLGGKRFTFDVNPDAKILILPDYGDEVIMRRGAVNAGAGVHAARHFLGAGEFQRLRELSKAELVREAHTLAPKADWSRYFDGQEILEGVGGILGRRAGYDAFWLADKKMPQFSEFVALTSRALREKPSVASAAPLQRGVARPATEAVRPAPATFRGWQERPGGEPFALYDLTEDVPGHPQGSTVSAETLRGLGYEPSAPPAKAPPAFGAGNVLFTRERKEAAEARLREKGQRLTAGLDPTLLKDLVEVGGFYVEGGLREFAAWSDRMARELGERVRPHLQAVWDEIQRQRAGGREAGVVDVTPPGARTTEPPAPPSAPAGRTEAPPSEGRGPGHAPPEPRFPDSVPPAVQRIGARAAKLAGDIRSAADRLGRLNEQAQVVAEQGETIRETGTLAPEARRPFRETGEKPETFGVRVSERDIAETQAALVDLARRHQELRREVEQAADPFSAQTARAAERLLGEVTARLNALSQEFRAQRFAAGRAVKRFDRPVPSDILDALHEAGVLTDWLQRAKPKIPIYTNLLRSVREWGSLGEADRRQAFRDLVDAWRLNLFAVTSWTLDLVGNASEITMQVAGGVGRDTAQLLRGHANVPSLQGLFRAFRDRALHRGEPLEERIEAGVGRTIGGERIGGTFRGALTGAEPGTFTERATVPSRALDLLVGTPLYAKGAFDTAAKRLMATATVWRDAIEEANRRGLAGRDRRDFYRDFMVSLPEETVKHAVEAGNKAGFNRPLSKFEEWWAGSVAVRLFGDVFGRWPFQFTRTLGEWLGADPAFFRKVKAGQVSAEEVAAWLTKAAAGWGALYLLNETLWDRVDFNSMEYVHEDGSRTRLSNRDPIPTALWLLAVIKWDEAKATGALQYASVPGSRMLAGEGGGLLGGLIMSFTKAVSQADVNPRGVARELTSTVNRLIPGQAILSALESVFDPAIREGVGANVPGVSALLPEAIDPTTGEPLQPRQRILGQELPTIGGTPIPGAQRVLPPVHRLLSRYGLIVYRGPRTPIAGMHPAEVPADILREWTVEFGRERARLLAPLVGQMDAGTLERQNPDNVRERVQKRDALAAKLATNRLNQKYGTQRRLPRRPTIRERRGPEAFEQQRQEFQESGAAR